MKLYSKTMPSMVGQIKLVANDKALVAVLWDNGDLSSFKNVEMAKNGEHPILKRASKQLSEYFSGKRKIFDLPLQSLGTDFQAMVWQVLKEIPYGTTWSYAKIAEKIDRPKAVRAVGRAIGSNPISIIVPCHRVIGSNGKLTGFAGGLPTKASLLQLESNQL